MAGKTCDVCGVTYKHDHETVVAASSLGPVSFAYCRQCSRLGLEPYVALIGGLSGLRSKEEVDPWVWEMVVLPSLEAHGTTEEQFWAELEQADKRYLEEMERGRQAIAAGEDPPPFDPTHYDEEPVP
jgi:hypothetical protein